MEAGVERPPGVPRRTIRRISSTSNFELFSWLFVRVSGILLIFLALGHFAIMHVINDVTSVNFAFIAARWASPVWRTYDALLLILALIHGATGMRVIIDDYVRPPGWRLAAQTVLWVTTGVTLIVGSLTLLTFQTPAS